MQGSLTLHGLLVLDGVPGSFTIDSDLEESIDKLLCSPATGIDLYEEIESLRRTIREPPDEFVKDVPLFKRMLVDKIKVFKERIGIDVDSWEKTMH